MRLSALLLAILIASLSGGCVSSTPLSYAPGPADLGREIATVAVSQHGTPYRYGGSAPSGFDCSGLVMYSHDVVGIPVPRTAREQHRAATPVSARSVQAGDLVFFQTSGRGVSHVGVIVEDDRFVHAPSSGKHVVISRLNEKYWKERVVGYGRFYQ